MKLRRQRRREAMVVTLCPRVEDLPQHRALRERNEQRLAAMKACNTKYEVPFASCRKGLVTTFQLMQNYGMPPWKIAEVVREQTCRETFELDSI